VLPCVPCGETLAQRITEEALQWRSGRSRQIRRRPQAPSPRHLRVRSCRPADSRLPTAGPNDHSLLAQHPLELALIAGPQNPASREPLLLVILGPTASGKTSLSIALAKKFAGEIANCDSVALYSELNSGTAKPTPSERAQVPHHLFDCVNSSEDVTAGEYARQARQVLAEIKARQHLPILVGGTGLYLRALFEGLFPGPQRSEELRARLRQRSEQRGSTYLHRILQRLDPATAAKVHPNDAPKLIRGIEVCLASRQKMSDLWQLGRDPLTGFSILRLGLDPERSLLYERINQRAREMFERGLIEETEHLLQKYGPVSILNSLGYKQAVQLLKGELSREAALASAQQAHRNYAKRQMTWFRREPDVHWLSGYGDDPAIQRKAMDLVDANRQDGLHPPRE